MRRRMAFASTFMWKNIQIRFVTKMIEAFSVITLVGEMKNENLSILSVGMVLESLLVLKLNCC